MALPHARTLSTSFASIILAVVAGCATGRDTPAALVVFPAPPDPPRIQYLTWASSAEQVEGPISTVSKLALGDDPVNRPALDKPYGLAARDGVVYVCDTKLPGICRLDFKNHAFTIMGMTGPGKLRTPLNLVIDPLGYKFVADAQREQVVVFGPDDQYVTVFDLPKPCRPVDVALWEDELYVLDNDETCQVVVLNRTTSEVIRTFGALGEGPGEFRIPNSLSFDAEGNLYVSDTLNWRVQKLTHEGKPIWSRGGPGYRLGEFGRPRSVRVAPNDLVFVADAATEIVQMLNSDGEVLMHFGGPGTLPGTLVLPAGIAVDATSIPYFSKYIHKDFNAEYLVFVSSQYGPRLINVYAFGSFPEGYRLSRAQIATLPSTKPKKNTDAGTVPPDTQNPPGQPRDDSGSERRD